MLKSSIQFLALMVILPLGALELVAKRLLRRDVFFSVHAQFLSLIPGKLGSYLRVAYYRLTLDHCSKDVAIHFGSRFTHSTASVEDRVYIGTGCVIGMASIGRETMLADNVLVLSGRHQHGTEPGSTFQGQQQTFQRLNIGKNVWIGSAAVIMADIGDNSIVGAGSVVTRPVSECQKVAGNPARPIGSPLAVSDYESAPTSPTRDAR
jgi:acetyltransferase-like isoleucine patch superfamily enzyme